MVPTQPAAGFALEVGDRRRDGPLVGGADPLGDRRVTQAVQDADRLRRGQRHVEPGDPDIDPLTRVHQRRIQSARLLGVDLPRVQLERAADPRGDVGAHPRPRRATGQVVAGDGPQDPAERRSLLAAKELAGRDVPQRRQVADVRGDRARR